MAVAAEPEQLLKRTGVFCCNMNRLAVVQGDPAESVFFIEDGDCQVGYNQRRTADEDLISAVSTLVFCCCMGCCTGMHCSRI